MNKMIKISMIMAGMLSTSFAGGYVDNPKVEARTTILDSIRLNIEKKEFFSTYEVGVSKITLGDKDHKAFVLASKTGYKFTNDISVYMLGESNIYRHNGDINNMGISGLGFSYDMPYTKNKLTIGVAAGLGTNLNYNQVFKNFRESYDFGFAYRGEISYNVSDEFSLNVSYTKFDFNTNATKLEDTKPDIIGITLSYSFDFSSLLD